MSKVQKLIDYCIENGCEGYYYPNEQLLYAVLLSLDNEIDRLEAEGQNPTMWDVPSALASGVLPCSYITKQYARSVTTLKGRNLTINLVGQTEITGNVGRVYDPVFDEIDRSIATQGGPRKQA
jgi:hypothetical protein